MKVTACGRYCDVCKKDVIDFSDHSRESYLKLYENNPELCGRFRQEQVDLSLIRPIRFPFRKNILTWFSGLMLLFSYKSSEAQTDSIKTEQTVPGSDSTAGIYKGTIMIKKALPSSEDRKPGMYYYPPQQKPFLTTKKRMFYWSKRFPFVTYRWRNRRTMGNVRFL